MALHALVAVVITTTSARRTHGHLVPVPPVDSRPVFAQIRAQFGSRTM